ncbi:MAG: PEP-CTERM sorting domain-containing protein [Nitrospirae bacterium]|nr:PEP-CTERM sorting domain-containing protein [Nitrospirota bacterium]
MKFAKVFSVMLVCLFLVLPGKGHAVPFNSLGWVNPDFQGTWNPTTLEGTARYTFDILTDGIDVNLLALAFEGDIFDLSVLDASDFTIVNPSSGWSTAIFNETTSDGTIRWEVSGGSTLINSTNDPIIIDVNFKLLSSSMYYYGSASLAGESGDWEWDEAQGANTSWSQKYILQGPGIGSIGPFNVPDISGGSTAVPEPGTLVLLGSGLVGVAFYARRMKKY